MPTRLALSLAIPALLLPASAQQCLRERMPGGKVSPGTLVRVKILNEVNSAEARNGQQVRGVIAEPVTVDGRQLAAGDPVTASVVAVARAGQLLSAGEVSLQIESVANQELISDVTVILGEEGPKELPDSAPQKGTEAVVRPDSVLTFNVVPPGLAHREVGTPNLTEAMN